MILQVAAHAGQVSHRIDAHSTRADGSSVSRAASTQPAVPAPTTM
jgi:hypothetical protein